MITAIILAAGLNERFGSPKALAKIGNNNAIEHLINNLLSSKIDKINIVLGAFNELIKPHVLNHKRIEIVYNKDYLLGQTSSFKTGVKSCLDQSAIMLCPVDCPLILPTTLNHLITVMNHHTPDIIIPTFNSKKGHPPVFAPSMRAQIINLPDSVGINLLYQDPQRKIHLEEINDAGICKTFNTLEELTQILNES